MVDWIEPTLKSDVSSGWPPFAAMMAAVTSAGSGSPPVEPPGNGAIFRPLIVESVDDVPSSPM